MVHVGSVRGKVSICKTFLVCFHYLFIEQWLGFKVMLSPSPGMLVREMCIVWGFFCSLHEFIHLQNLCIPFMGNLVLWPSRGVLHVHMESITHDL